MEHFPERAWADFVRGFENCEHRQMRSHVASACRDCTRIHQTWKRVRTVASRESLYTPPAHATRMAKLEFARTFSTESDSAVFAKLTFDTSTKPALAGIRSGAAAVRQMLYETAGVAVDLHFDHLSAPKLIHVTGQILNKREPYGAVANAAVTVWTPQGLPIAEARTNDFGEFRLEFKSQDGLKLSIQTAGQPGIRIFLASIGPTNQSVSSSVGSDGN
jgi:hypothetical protein